MGLPGKGKRVRVVRSPEREPVQAPEPVEAPAVEPEEYVIVVDPCRSTDPLCPRWRGLIRDAAGYWRRPTDQEITDYQPPVIDQPNAS